MNQISSSITPPQAPACGVLEAAVRDAGPEAADLYAAAVAAAAEAHRVRLIRDQSLRLFAVFVAHSCPLHLLLSECESLARRRSLGRPSRALSRAWRSCSAPKRPSQRK